jgi:hypothetical protein
MRAIIARMAMRQIAWNESHDFSRTIIIDQTNVRKYYNPASVPKLLLLLQSLC